MQLKPGDSFTLHSNQIDGNYVREKIDPETGEVRRTYDRHFAVPGRYTVIDTHGAAPRRLIVLRGSSDAFECDEYCLRAILGEWSAYESSEAIPDNHWTAADAEEYEAMRNAERDMERSAEDRITGFLRD